MSGSLVFGSLRDGVFDGKIITPHETYYVERLSKYPHLTTTNSTLHSVIYADHEVKDPFHTLRTGKRDSLFQGRGPTRSSV